MYNPRVYYEHPEGKDARRVEQSRQLLAMMEQFDGLVMAPLIAYGMTAYKEKPLEDKLTSLMNKFEANKPLITHA